MRTNIFYLLVLGILFNACKNESFKDFHNLIYNTGSYKIVVDSLGPSAAPGDYYIYSLLIKDNNDKIIEDKRFKQNRTQKLKDTTFYKNIEALTETLYQLSKGDSAILFTPVTETYKTPETNNSDTLFFYIKVLDIVDENKMLDLYEDEILKNEAEDTEARIKLIEVDQLTMKTLDEYKKGLLKDKLQNGIEGIQYYIVKKGIGEKAKPGDKVKVGYYAMTKETASPFENSFRKGKDFSFTVGSDKLIKGMNYSVMQMNKNMKAVFFIPYTLAFGEEGRPPVIPEKSDLVIYIELHDIL